MLVTLSLREALLMRYESPEVIDQTFGEGVYHGIKQPQGPFARLRKLWSRVLDEQKALQPARVAALNAHLATRETCLNTGLSEREVTTWLQTRPLRARLRPAS